MPATRMRCTCWVVRCALKAIQQGQRFDVILCDLMMPDLSGMDLHAELLELAPEQAEKIIFMTGGAFTGPAADFLATVPNPRIEKPFDVLTVRSAVERALA